MTTVATVAAVWFALELAGPVLVLVELAGRVRGVARRRVAVWRLRRRWARFRTTHPEVF